MSYVYVDPHDVLDDLSDDELVEELKRRRKYALEEWDGSELVSQLYDEFRGKPAPWVVRQLVWQVMGRVI